MNNCNYQKAFNYIKNNNNGNVNTCLIIGPTGPTGPAGPATINIGDVTTGASGDMARVENVGTNENVILNFITLNKKLISRFFITGKLHL